MKTEINSDAKAIDVQRLVRPCPCGRNMIPHHRQIHPGSLWWVCESWNCQEHVMTEDPRVDSILANAKDHEPGGRVHPTVRNLNSLKKARESKYPDDDGHGTF
jgi:hypothetical protein